MELLERDDERAALAAAIAASREAGRIVVVAGEAGIGKTALVAAACAGLPPGSVHRGACDPLITPRALGPLHDVARTAGGPLAAALEHGAREEVLRAALDLLDDGAVLVVDDVHWADDATLDLLVLLGRRLAQARGCVVLTCRSDVVAEREEVRRVLAALPRDGTLRLEPAPLSPAAVEELARRAGRDAADLHAVSGGNPFFVTEVLAAPATEAVPASVRDAVALRLAAVGSAARAVAELAAVCPGPAALDLLERARGDAAGAAEAVDACIQAGLLQLQGTAVAFRHDLARRAVEAAVPPVRRRGLDAAILRALEAAGDADPARLAHHARRAGDDAAVRRHAPDAARAADFAGGHRQALEHWEAALAVAPDGDERAAALDGVAVQAYLCADNPRALEAREALLELHRSTGDELRVGDDLRWSSRLLWWLGRSADAVAAGDAALAVLERFPGTPELARALSGGSQLAMLGRPP